MAYIQMNAGESFESGYRRFKKKVFNEGILKDLKKHEYFVKPSEKRRIDKQQRIKKMRKLQMKEYRRGQIN